MKNLLVHNVLRAVVVAVFFLLLLGSTGAVALAQTTPPTSAWSILNAPGANTTYPMGISGNNIVGQYSDGVAGPYGFLYDGTSWTTLNRPGAAWTVVAGISGDNMVGYSSTGNFLFDGISWTTINNAPGSTWTNVHGIDGNNVVGSYGNASGGRYGFIYNATADTWTTLDFPGAISTAAYAMDGNNVVGIYDGDTSGTPHGFLYDGTTWTTLDFPGANWTHPYSISGNNIVGVYYDGYGYQGFLYNGTSWTTLNFNNERNGTQTQAFGISGNNIVGAYNDASGMHGFLVNILTLTTVALSPIDNQTVNAGQVVTFIAIATDSDPEGVITYFYAASTTASNMATIDPLSGAFSWDTTGVTPDVYSFNVQAAGSTGGYDIYNVFITVTAPPTAPAPTDKDQCKNGGWKTFTNPYFKNQGQCVSYVQANERS